jgi:transglutaminase-like putative cysteine protease/tetratricopeptide (TPR) repeat protein
LAGWKFLRASIIADAALLIFIFSAARSAGIGIYLWPIITIILFGAVVFLQALALLFSMPPQIKLRAKETIPAAAALLAIVLAGGFLFLKPLQEQAAEMGGGLLEPKLFNFDFSQYLKLDSEISMKNDLVLIVKKENDGNYLIRRSVLSGYSGKQGFYRIEELDEKTHPQRLPGRTTSFTPPDYEALESSFQEYFLVNIEASALIAINQPVTVYPYESWDASSFKSAYGVESLVSSRYLSRYSANGAELPTAEQFGLSESEFKIYTEYGNDERIRALAENITDETDSYAEKILAIYGYLKYGDYRYSLKPGIAPDGDQLGWFLFRAKKGYCSYFAFSMTLLLRSIGIPARVAIGFSLDLDTSTFDYYPVRSDMVHAWVEVAFPKIGWIEYNPTTDFLAEGEEYLSPSGTEQALFEKLMREILENKSELKIREGAEETQASGLNLFAQSAIGAIWNLRGIILAAFMIVLFIYIRCGPFLSVLLTKDPRKKTVRLFKHACRRLRLAGIRRSRDIGEAEWALKLNDRFLGVYPMYLCAAAARFAPEFSKAGFNMQKENYNLFRASYKERVPLARRILAWLFPPLAATLSHGKKSGGLIILILVLGIVTGSRTGAQDNGQYSYTADQLYLEAGNANDAEVWDKAIELYREGSKLFPDDERFPWALGNLYYSKALYTLAWDEYRKTEAIIPDNITLLIRIARTAGYMNRDHLSVEYYERALELSPDNTEVIGNLAWMYFKVHRLSDGESLLLSALEQFPDSADFSMTLGTIYSEMYRYDESKLRYSKAIEAGNKLGDRVFTAIAWYNLSILESQFYRFDLCMDALNSSLNTQDRASGRIGRGELFKYRLELESALYDFEAAYETDTSPLAKLSLAEAYQLSGRLEEAQLYAEDCLRGSDNSWMLFYGIDTDRYKRDIHQILAHTYYGLAETEKLRPWTSLSDKIKSFFRTASYKLKYAVNIRLYRKYCLAAANSYSGEIIDGEGPHLKSYTQYYNAFVEYPRRAYTYLNKAREFKTAIIPASTPGFDFLEGWLFGNEALMERALYGFDPIWEKKDISECYREFAKPEHTRLFNPRRINSDWAAQELFALNRGALRQSGIKLPVRMNLAFTGEAAGQRQLERALAAAGFKKSVSETGARFALNIRISGTRIDGFLADCELADTAGETQTLRFQFPLRAAERAEYYALARNLGNAVFIVE